MLRIKKSGLVPKSGIRISGLVLISKIVIIGLFQIEKKSPKVFTFFQTQIFLGNPVFLNLSCPGGGARRTHKNKLKSIR